MGGREVYFRREAAAYSESYQQMKNRVRALEDDIKSLRDVIRQLYLAGLIENASTATLTIAWQAMGNTNQNSVQEEK